VYLFEGLKQKIAEYLPPERVQLVQEAFVLAHEAHDGQMRSSGDPYITHPVAVTSILADMHLDHETLMAALLHDVIEDTHYSQEDLAEAFGDTVADLVEGVSKLDADCVQPLAGHVRLEIAVVVQNVDCAVLAVNGEDLSRVKHAPPRPISTHVVAHLEGLWHSAH